MSFYKKTLRNPPRSAKSKGYGCKGKPQPGHALLPYPLYDVATSVKALCGFGPILNHNMALARLHVDKGDIKRKNAASKDRAATEEREEHIRSQAMHGAQIYCDFKKHPGHAHPLGSISEDIVSSLYEPTPRGFRLDV
ncbi:hypothetical protein VNO77_42374 [Canavalia gladiata]|uniref:Uncharacterized protein n=1 Tax=Canavalia gladiata TaxID=3824 RepID=A0AAN9PTC5_CANGL